MRCFPNIILVLVCLFITSLHITTHAAQASVSNERITTASGVKLRNLPQSKAQEVTRLRLGTVVTVVGTSTAKEKIGTSEDFWYSVKTSDGKTGWLFGSFTAPFDAGKREQTYLKLAQDRLTLENKTFGDLVDLHAFLVHTITEVKSPNIVAEIELLRFQTLAESLQLIPIENTDKPPYSVWIKENEKDALLDEPSGTYIVRTDRLWELEKKYHSLPISDRIAWTAAKAPLGGECEGDVSCWFAVVKLSEIEYITRQPKGAHVNDAINTILENLTEINKQLASLDNDFKGNDPNTLKYKTDFKADATKVRKILIDTLLIPRKAELAKQLDLLIKALS